MFNLPSAAKKRGGSFPAGIGNDRRPISSRGNFLRKFSPKSSCRKKAKPKAANGPFRHRMLLLSMKPPVTTVSEPIIDRA